MKHKIIRIVFFFLVSLSSSFLFSQTSETANVVVENQSIVSETLEEERNIQVYLPKDYYKDEQRSFPVLYVLDGQEYFLHGIAYQDMLYFRDKSPAFIVIGIHTDRRRRRTLFHAESDKFIHFLKQELIPFVDTNYRTKKEKERLFFGWEMAAGLGFEVLATENNLFSGFILASPTHATKERMEAVKHVKNNSKNTNVFMLVSAAPEEYWITQDSTFLSLIKEKNANETPWRFTVFDREDHYTTPLKTIHEGLSDYFVDYKPIRLRSIEAYDNYGGLEALRVYYKNRGERYDLPIDIHKETKHFLLYNAMQENNYERFVDYVSELDGYIETNTRDIWFNRYAKFYLKHGNKKEALRIFQFGLNKLPESILLLESLGDYYVLEKNKRKAESYFKKALSINSDLDSVKKKLDSLH